MSETSIPVPELPLMGLATLARHAFTGADLTPIAQQLAARFEHYQQHDASALMDLATIHFLIHQPETALEFQHAAMQQQRRYRLSTSPNKPSFRLLVLHGDGDLMDNLPVEFLLTGASHIAMDAHYMTLGDALPEDVDDYDALLVAVGESDRQQPLLQQLHTQLQACSIPVLNRPEYICQTTREGAAQALQHCSKVWMPMSQRVHRDELQAMATAQQDIAIPAIIRPVASHAGHGLTRLDAASDIPAYLAEQADEAMFYLSPYIDYCSQDGHFRKYRVVLIRGKAYLAHLAISSHWIVHYLNADMIGDGQKCMEEAQAMQTFDANFGRTHQQAFQQIYDALPLDYLILDCADAPDGRLLVFEVDTSAIVHDMDSEELFPYKTPQMRNIFAAFQHMLDHLH